MVVWIGSTFVVAAIGLLFWAVSAPREPNLVQDNLRSGGDPTDSRRAVLEASAAERIIEPMVAFLARQARKLTSSGVADRIQRQLQLAGLTGRYTVEQVLAVRLFLAVVGVVLAGFRLSAGTEGTAWLQALLIAMIFFLVPNVMLSRLAKERQHEIELAFPDVLDQITVSVEAGLGFDSAMARAVRNGRGPFAEELSRVLQDVQVGRSRDQALEGLIQRTEVDDLRQFVFAVRQAERYGLPVAKVLRVQATEARDRRRARAEEHAAQIPVKIVFPLVFCILPALFVVVLGPAAIEIFDTI